MTHREPSQALVLAATLAARGVLPYHAAAIAERLQSLAKAASSNGVAECNGWKKEGQFERRAASLTKQAAALLAEWRTEHVAPATVAGLAGLSIRIGGDPRGYCLHILGLPGNTWGGDSEGFGL